MLIFKIVAAIILLYSFMTSVVIIHWDGVFFPNKRSFKHIVVYTLCGWFLIPLYFIFGSLMTVIDWLHDNW